MTYESNEGGPALSNIKEGQPGSSPQLTIRENGARPEGTPHKWYAVYTTPRHEKRVSQHCEIRNIECFLPLYHVQSHWKSGTREELQLPLFPGYLFVHIGQEERVRVLNVPGVLQILRGVGREPAALDTTEIESLRDGLDLRDAFPHALLLAGQSVRIRNGALAGMEGIIVRTKNLLRVVITLKLLMQSIAVEIDIDDLELLVPSTDTGDFGP
jgi:transcription antitermination factor NusG